MGILDEDDVYTKEVVVPENRKLTIEIELPPEFPVGEAILTLEAVGPQINRAAEIRGKGKGMVWMAEDFDAPLEELAEYQ